MFRKFYFLAILFLLIIFMSISVNISHGAEALHAKTYVNQENSRTSLSNPFLYLKIYVKTTKIVIPTHVCKFQLKLKIHQFIFLILLQKTRKLKKSPLREQIYALITENPGIWLREICRILDKAIGVVQYHLYVLLSSGLVFSVKKGKYRYFFPTAYKNKPLNKILNQKLLEHSNKP